MESRIFSVKQANDNSLRFVHFWSRQNVQCRANQGHTGTRTRTHHQKVHYKFVAIRKSSLLNIRIKGHSPFVSGSHLRRIYTVNGRKKIPMSKNQCLHFHGSFERVQNRSSSILARSVLHFGVAKTRRGSANRVSEARRSQAGRIGPRFNLHLPNGRKITKDTWSTGASLSIGSMAVPSWY